MIEEKEYMNSKISESTENEDFTIQDEHKIKPRNYKSIDRKCHEIITMMNKNVNIIRKLQKKTVLMLKFQK